MHDIESRVLGQGFLRATLTRRHVRTEPSLHARHEATNDIDAMLLDYTMDDGCSISLYA